MEAVAARERAEARLGYHPNQWARGQAVAWSKLSRHQRGYGTHWVKLRESILKRDHYLCVVCQANGRVSAATSVDHRVPKSKGGTDDPANLQSICTPCRAEKDAIDRGRPLRAKRPKTGLDGWPLDP